KAKPSTESPHENSHCRHKAASLTASVPDGKPLQGERNNREGFGSTSSGEDTEASLRMVLTPETHPCQPDWACASGEKCSTSFPGVQERMGDFSSWGCELC